MLLEGIGEAIEQQITVGAVVLGIVGQRLQSPLLDRLADAFEQHVNLAPLLQP